MCLLQKFVFYKQKAAYEIRISDWSSDVCSSDLTVLLFGYVLLVGWYFFVSDQQDSLTTLANKENQLKQEFSTKQAKSVNLEALQQQLDEKIGRASCRERGCQYV